MTSKYADSAGRFLADVEGHQLTILHEHGLYRHLRFAKPTRGEYWFDLITVPGALIFRGDTDAQFIFARDPDMLTFFRRKSGWNRGDINPQYWAEKITDGRERATTYSVTSFREQVWSSVRDQASEFPGLAKAVQREMGEYDVSFEQGARRMLDEFGYSLETYVGGIRRPNTFRFPYASEWNLADWDPWYLWACHAIAWGVDMYDARKSEQSGRASESTIAP